MEYFSSIFFYIENILSELLAFLSGNGWVLRELLLLLGLGLVPHSSVRRYCSFLMSLFPYKQVVGTSECLGNNCLSFCRCVFLVISTT